MTENLLRVLVVDDERNLRESLAAFLRTEQMEALTADSGEAARDLLERERVEAVIVDLRMPGMSGLDFLDWLRGAGPSIPALMISAHGDVADAVEAMKRGAADYLVKPFDPVELSVRLRKAIGDARLIAAVHQGAALKTDRSQMSWIGEGPKMRELHRLAERVAPTNSTVLVTGESGTGKEVLAGLIHRLSARADGPFIPINLGGIPENLLESELFGYERGAFTGAESRKIGLFELAVGGTLFLDEVGDMPLPLQVKMLRVLQEKRIMRLGGTQPIPIDCRIIAATNKDLEGAVASGAFREDLFYRLNVIRLTIPPLRERREDIPSLVGLFVARFASEMGKGRIDLEPDALRLLSTYPFPGNVRELENAVERAVILSDGGKITARDFSFAGAAMRPTTSEESWLEGNASFELRELEKRAIAAALAKYEGHREKSAAALGITRRTLLNKMNEYDLR